MAAAKTTRRGAKESPDCRELLTLELQEIHNAESQLARALPRLMKNVEAEQLRKCLEERLDQGERLVSEVETALDELGASPGRKKNVAAEGLLNDAREHAQEIEQGPALDAVLIAAIQKTEHYCIAAWGTAKSLAEALDEQTTVRTMERALEEGKSMDELLTRLAEEQIMPQLLSEESDEEASEDEETAQEEGNGRNRSRSSKKSENRTHTR